MKIGGGGKDYSHIEGITLKRGELKYLGEIPENFPKYLRIAGDNLKLKTKVKAFIGTKYVGDYTVELKDDCENTTLVIIPCSNMGGQWVWHLVTLMGFDGWNLNKVSDELSLDWGKNWHVTGMLDVYKEIINEVLGEVI